MTNILNNSLLEEIQSVQKRSDKIDTVTFDVPALIRLMEICREDIKSDDALHEFVTKILNRSKEEAGILKIKDIEYIESEL